jgi:hypothetical protein
MKTTCFNTASFALCCVLVPATAKALGQSQSNPEILTNQVVIKMVEAQVPADLIVKTIAESQTRFNLAPADLVSLKQSGVPDETIRAIVARQSGGQTVSQVVTQAEVPIASPASPPAQAAKTPRQRAGGSPRIYIEPQNGFESYISAAMVKKQVPAVVTQNRDEAMFALSSAVQSKEESTGSKVARCLFLYCAGMAGTQTVTTQLINLDTEEVVWAYNVRKGAASAYQSTAESLAKHLKEFLQKHRQ